MTLRREIDEVNRASLHIASVSFRFRESARSRCAMAEAWWIQQNYKRCGEFENGFSVAAEAKADRDEKEPSWSGSAFVVDLPEGGAVVMVIRLWCCRSMCSVTPLCSAGLAGLGESRIQCACYDIPNLVLCGDMWVGNG